VANKITSRHFYSPIYEPKSTLPIYPRSVGMDIYPEGISNEPSCKDFYQLFWSVKGCGILNILGTEYNFSEGKIFVLPPKIIHFRKSVSPKWMYRWVSFKGNLDSDIVENFGFKLYPTKAGNCPEKLFETLQCNIVSPTAFTERTNSNLLFQILSLASGEIPDVGTKDNTLVEKCISIIKNNLSSPQLSVDMLSVKLKVHRSTLSKAFHSSTGRKLVDYIAMLRMRTAIELLQNEENSVAEIGRMCGILEPNYFSKFFKRNMGVSPKEFRKNFLQ
jgi:AraC-like DNA-binding protein